MAKITARYKINGVEVIHLTGRSYGSGSYGTYFRLKDKMGAKLLRDWGCPDIEHVTRTQGWKQALKEYKRLKISKSIIRNCPKPFKVVIARADEANIYCDQPENSLHYYPCILMEHIEGRKISNSQNSENRLAKAENWLETKDFFHQDLHEENIIEKDGRFFIIDFGSPVFYKGKKI